MGNVQAFGHAAQTGHQAARLCGRMTHRPSHLQGAQSHQVSHSYCSAEDAASGRDVPTPFVVARRDGQTDSALHLHTQQERMQEILTAHDRLTGPGHQGRCHRARRMNSCRPMRVVVVKDVRRKSMKQCYVCRVKLFSAADQWRIAAAEGR